MAPAKKSPKKAAKPSSKDAGAKKAKKAASPPAKPAKKAASPPPPAPEPEEDDEPPFVREATAAERKAALEALLEKEGVSAVFPTVQNPNVPKPTPQYVRERSAHERKAVVEQLAQEAGVSTALAKAPWKRRDDAGDAPAAPARRPAAPAAAPAPDAPAHERTSPRLQMTKAPIESTAGRSPPRVVVLDTNALMMQFQFHVDIEREVRRILNFNFEIVVPTVVVHELERLVKEGNQKEAAEARMALELAKTFRVEESGNDGDTGILRMAEKLNAVVVTNDKVLRARLRAKGIPNIYMRSRAFLTLDGHIPGM